jgi:hypothetical protein
MTTRSTAWASIATDAISGFEVADDDQQYAHTYACICSAIGRMYGWTDPRVAQYQAKFYSLRNPDGGWGLNRPFTSPGASLNPADTTYTITLADNVGLTLLDLYRQGLIPFDDIHDVAALLMSVQSYLFSTGRGLAYSLSGTDDVNATNNRNVHNVNAMAGWFLLQAQGAGFTASGLNMKVVDIARLESATWNRTTKWWSYRGNLSSADTDHTAVSAWALYHSMAGEMARETAYKVMTDPSTTDEPMAMVARARLTNLPGRPGSWSTTEPGVSLFAVLGDAWIDDCAAFVLDPPALRGLAQMAYWAALNAEVT